MEGTLVSCNMTSILLHSTWLNLLKDLSTLIGQPALPCPRSRSGYRSSVHWVPKAQLSFHLESQRPSESDWILMDLYIFWSLYSFRISSSNANRRCFFVLAFLLEVLGRIWVDVLVSLSNVHWPSPCYHHIHCLLEPFLGLVLILGCCFKGCSSLI